MMPARACESESRGCCMRALRRLHNRTVYIAVLSALAVATDTVCEKQGTQTISWEAQRKR
ncbi:hypothetical protein B566_EDAN007516 [Ephemera danica]|nr:hypothetical protein B566_EDAN007516 [Ephemera danica]